jgi:hypothetical protein
MDPRYPIARDAYGHANGTRCRSCVQICVFVYSVMWMRARVHPSRGTVDRGGTHPIGTIIDKLFTILLVYPMLQGSNSGSSRVRCASNLGT